MNINLDISGKRGITTGFIVMLIMLFLFINVDWVYGQYAQQVENVLIIYFFLLLIPLATYAVRIPTVSEKSGNLINFVIMFAVTAMVVTFLPSLFVLGTFEQIKLAIAFGLLHGFVKAYIEEVVFRGILFDKIGILWSNVAFSFFHLGVLVSMFGLTATIILPLMTLTILGFVWTYIARFTRFGIMGSTGSHFAWNLNALGINIFKAIGL